MLTLIGYEGIIQNFYRISKCLTSNKSRSVRVLRDLRDPYLDFLEWYQPEVPVNRSSDIFIKDGSVEDKLSAAFSRGTKALDDRNQSNLMRLALSIPDKQEKIEQARKALHELFSADRSLEQVFKLSIHSVFVRKSDPSAVVYTGSTSGAVGVIWLGGEMVGVGDLMELFVHELVHNLVFVDELNFPHYDYKEITKSENYARSAILSDRRPLDKVVHSIIVATELIEGRKTFLANLENLHVHQNSAKMIGSVISACESVFAVKNISKIVHPRALGLVEKCFDRYR